MEEISEYFHIFVLHFSRDQTKLLNKPNERLLIYPPPDIYPYLSRISKRYNGDSIIIIAELLHQSDKHLSTFTEFPYPTTAGTIRNMLVETHIFTFHRIKEDEIYKFVPNKEIL